MMNSFHNSIKYLRLVSLNSAVNSLKECRPSFPIKTNGPNIKVNKANKLIFSPRSVGVEIGRKIDQNTSKYDPLSYTPIINPRSILPLIDTNWKKDEIGIPNPPKDEIQAARLIVIRRKKMKKHKRRKLWKRMRHRWARVKQRRRQRKEKVFQNELLMMIKQAEEFTAEHYVADRLAKANHIPLPTRWRHKKLPEFIIRQLLGIDKKINYKHTDVYKA